MPPHDLGWTAADPAAIAGRDVWLVHPWMLGEPATPPDPDTLVLGVAVADFHQAWPWSEKRWRFVTQGLNELTALRWYDNAASLGAALRSARRVRSVQDPHLAPWLAAWATCTPAPTLFRPIDRRCDSFSAWWNRASRGLHTAADLLQPRPSTTS